ncbi:hypothetical protein [Kineosporia babensis]|uniref:DUF932 domain-containing protein n=1 Tax=Kineosporia babensis TaxID=499548 RepID=A0A9X1NN65_9ACTN|nr:hypothetical protein [Kineosporia babensis]MCD5316158.1 hypothetical protein [Kineosporia babensis]
MSANTIVRAELEDPTRNMALANLATLLKDQSTRALDVIAGSGALHASGGQLILRDTVPQLGADGVTMTAGTYAINSTATGQLAEKLTIPQAYLRRLGQDHPDLFDANVNGWLSCTDKRFLVRALRTRPNPNNAPDAPFNARIAGLNEALGGGVDGTVRAFLSDSYSRIDHLDVLVAALDGVKQSGEQVVVEGCDLTEQRMYVRVTAPGVQAMAPSLLKNYRSPFDSRPGSELPVVWGGFVMRNSETGGGAFSIEPRLTVRVCRNGMVMEQSVLRKTHLGARYAGGEGIVTWSAETLSKSLELITSQARDAVRAYLDPEYVARMVRQLEAISDKPVEDVDKTLKVVASKFKFSDSQQDSILAHFIRGADLSAGGVMHAITSTAQTLDADTAYEMESVAVQAMQLAAATN